LPLLPGPLPPSVGNPSPDTHSIYVSQSDWALLVAHDQAMRDWIEAAAGCLEGMR
jgi:hypothetical protein